MTIILGDCLEVMRTMEDKTISCVVTDPPYGLSFMGKGWDHATPSTEYWKEIYRLLKPGGHLLAMGGTRTFHRQICAIEDSGFEIRDCLMWIYGSGFPKSHNHFGLDGYGTALKPAYEPITMAMKPCEGTFKQNAEKWGQAGINIDECRIETEKGDYNHSGNEKKCLMAVNSYQAAISKSLKVTQAPPDSNGRWPANVILDEEAGRMLDEQSKMLKSGMNNKRKKPHSSNSLHPLGILERKEISYGDMGGASRFFYCAKASPRERNHGITNNEPSNLSIETCIDKPPKDPKITNNHPTVKPIKLMEYLIKLIMPPNDKEMSCEEKKFEDMESTGKKLDVPKKTKRNEAILLDPFAGSGTTILAAKRLGVNAIGIEKSEEYCNIARARLAGEGKD